MTSTKKKVYENFPLGVIYKAKYILSENMGLREPNTIEIWVVRKVRIFPYNFSVTCSLNKSRVPLEPKQAHMARAYPRFL